MTKRHFYLSLIILFAIATCHAQPAWYWGIRGGAPLNTINASPIEDVVDMATDPNGNVYILSLVKADLSATLSGYAGVISRYGADDILLASYDCKGNYRWHKSIGGYASDMPLYRGGLGVDAVGGVYVASMASSPQSGSTSTAVHFDTDTILTKGTKKSLFLVKYDTAGSFKWLRMPEPDTTNATNSAMMGITTDSGGFSYVHITSFGGVLSGANVILPGTGNYILKYNAQGNLLSFTQLQMQTQMVPFTQFTSKLARNPANGVFYLAGSYESYASGSLSMGGNPITNSAVVGAFNAQGGYLWHKTNNYQHTVGFYGRPQLDQQGNITLVGSLKAGGTLNDAFNGYTMSNPMSNITRECPLVVKMSPTGQNIWATNGISTNSNRTAALIQTDNEVIIGGATSGIFTWPGASDSLKFTGAGSRPFIARLSLATGAPIGMTHLPVSSGSEYNCVTSLAADKANNVYAGGTFGSQITVNGQTMTNSGGNSDFFVAKFGYDCDCVAPLANYSFTTSGTNTVNVTYTGTTPYTSISWNFGDGSTPDTTATPAHAYAAMGTYTVCVTVTNNCGSNTLCKQVQVTGTDIANIPGFAEVKVYPNPATQQLTIVNAVRGTKLEIYNTTGRLMLHKMLNKGTESIEIATLAGGIYILRFTDKDGQQGNARFVKQ